MEESKFTLVLVFIFGLVFVLIFLGIIKGLLGLCCCQKIGKYGLNLLVDLPRPLAHYQEKDLERRPVVYDVGGWPVHPDTLQKTVRVLPKRTEFCLNLIFFLAYPLAACVYICALCCCIRNYNKSHENACFKHVDVVRLVSRDSKNNKNSKLARTDLYKANLKEEQDTKYALDTMQKSMESLHELHIKVKPCQCP